MKKLLLIAFVLMLLPMTASAQWEFVEAFPPETLATDGNGMHGIAVDPDGKIWLQTFGATDSVQVAELNNEFQPVNVLYVYNPDGTEASFSPVKFLDFPGGARDTLGGFCCNTTGAWVGRTGRGLTTDADGNIIASQFDTLYKIDYTDGSGIAKVNTSQDFGGVLDGRGITEAAVDMNNNVFASGVFPGDPIAIYDSDLNYVGNAIDETFGFSRGFEVSGDGNQIYWAGYSNSAVVLYERPDEFSAYDSVGVIIPGMDSESMRRHPTTGNLWVAAGSPNDPPNDFPGFETSWRSNTWYEFDASNFADGTVPSFLNLITWNECETFDENGVCQESAGRPRGIGFSPDGEMAYVVQFSSPVPNIEVFMDAPFLAIERTDDAVPESFTLSQNYPNPFNPETQIQFTLKQAGQARLRIFDMLGREVDVLVDEALAPGTYTATFEAQGLASGTYLYMLEFADQRLSGTMTLLK